MTIHPFPFPFPFPFPARACATLAVLLTATAPAEAREGLELSGGYVADIAATMAGGADRKARFLDNLELGLDADLDKLWGVPATTVHIAALYNGGLRPNDSAQTLEGLDNIEVGRSAVRLFEAWGETALPGGSLRLGLYDLNSEFYASEAAGLLIAPPFGIGSELAATGSNGPSIFPSSALAARLRFELPAGKAYAQAAIVNARAQTFGDPGGVDLGFREGLIAIGEIGAGSRVRVNLGGWTYTRPAEALAAFDAAGNPLRERPAGLYAGIEARLAKGEGREIKAFVRGGIARGRTEPFVSSAQAGLFVAPALVGRDGSAFSVGLHQAVTSTDFRVAQEAAGSEPWQRERGIEITYADMVAPFLTLQPDLQLIERRSPAGLAPLAVHATLRMQFSF